MKLPMRPLRSECFWAGAGVFDLQRRFPFEEAKQNFYMAARHGLNAQFTWPQRAG